MIKKNIILTSATNNRNQKGIVTLENNKGETLVSLKTYGLDDFNTKLVLGIQKAGDFFKIEVENIKEDRFKINKEIDLNSKISCVLVSIENETASPIIWGSNETTSVWKNSFLYNFEEPVNEKIQNNYDDEIESQEEIESIITESLNSYENDELKDEYEEEIKVSFEEKNNTFYNSIKNQVEDLLNNYETEKALEEIIPNSKFVKVDYENNGNFYIFGIIYEEGQIRYIVYGIPGEYDIKPDDEYAKFYQWLPLNAENPEGYGYYLMYQDALNGENVKIEII